MSAIRLNRFMTLAGREPEFRAALQTCDRAVLASYGLTAEQIDALDAHDTGALVALGLRPGLCMTVTVFRNPTALIASGDGSEYFEKQKGAG